MSTDRISRLWGYGGRRHLKKSRSSMRSSRRGSSNKISTSLRLDLCMMGLYFKVINEPSEVPNQIILRQPQVHGVP